MAVTARLEGTNLGSAITKVKQAVAGLKLPESIRIEYGGTYKTQQNSFRDLMLVLLLGLVLVFLVLLFEFRTFSAPLAILSSAVLSTSGVFLALMLTGTTFNIASFMGLIMVIGIVSKNGILLLDADEKFRAAGMAPEEAMIQAGRRRLRPIMMTALAAVAGMLPLAPGARRRISMLQPLAIAVIGGIVISMALSLIDYPRGPLLPQSQAGTATVETKLLPMRLRRGRLDDFRFLSCLWSYHLLWRFGHDEFASHRDYRCCKPASLGIDSRTGPGKED